MRSLRNPDRPRSKAGSRTVAALTRAFLQEDINFLVTNRIPRRYATLLMGWFSRIRSRRLTRLSVGMWSLFDDLRLDEAKTQILSVSGNVSCANFATARGRLIRILASSRARAMPSLGPSAQCRQIRRFKRRVFHISLKELLGDEQLVERHREASSSLSVSAQVCITGFMRHATDESVA